MSAPRHNCRHRGNKVCDTVRQPAPQNTPAPDHTHWWSHTSLPPIEPQSRSARRSSVHPGAGYTPCLPHIPHRPFPRHQAHTPRWCTSPADSRRPQPTHRENLPHRAEDPPRPRRNRAPARHPTKRNPRSRNRQRHTTRGRCPGRQDAKRRKTKLLKCVHSRARWQSSGSAVTKCRI